jgi:hypothetical protein
LEVYYISATCYIDLIQNGVSTYHSDIECDATQIFLNENNDSDPTASQNLQRVLDSFVWLHAGKYPESSEFRYYFLTCCRETKTDKHRDRVYIQTVAKTSADTLEIRVYQHYELFGYAIHEGYAGTGRIFFFHNVYSTLLPFVCSGQPNRRSLWCQGT